MQPLSNDHNDGISSPAADKTYNLKLSGKLSKVKIKDEASPNFSDSDIVPKSGHRTDGLEKDAHNPSNCFQIHPTVYGRENSETTHSTVMSNEESGQELHTDHNYSRIAAFCGAIRNPSTAAGRVTASFICCYCPAFFLHESQLALHLRTHTGEKSFICSRCSFAFADKAHLTAHMQTHSGEKPYCCSHCNVSFAQKSTLRQHVRTHTGKKPFSSVQTHFTVISNKGRSNELHTDHNYSRIAPFSGASRIRSTAAGRATASFVCRYCPAFFLHKSKLALHLRTHTGERPFCCSHCNVSFTLKSTLTNHIHTHTGEKPFMCSQCCAAFAHKSNLSAHLRTHIGAKPFCCSHCNVSFAQKSTLRNHIRTHRGEKPFFCSHCNVSFALKSTLRKHISKHTGEKPFICSQCYANLANKATLSAQMRTHPGGIPFCCSYCNDSFSNIYLLAHQ